MVLRRSLYLITTLQLAVAGAALAQMPAGDRNAAPEVAVESIRDGVVWPGPPSATQAKLPKFARGKLIVKLKEGSNVEALGGAKDKHKLKIKEKKLVNVEHHRFKDLYDVQTADDADLPALAVELMENPSVDYAEPVSISHTQLTPNDPLFPQQWSLKNTKAEYGWNFSAGSPSVIIAVVDTGVAYNHPDLAANIWRDAAGNPGRDFVDVYTSTYTSAGYQLIAGEEYVGIDNDPADYNGHGTHVAGISAAAGGNGIGISGVCPSCKIMPVRAGFSMRSGTTDYGFFESDDIANAIIYAADNGARVINMSFGGSYSTVIEDAVNYADAKGVVLVGAAGNDNTNSVTYAYPGALSKVLAVAATGQSDLRAYYSNYGAWVDVAAPGGDGGSYQILSTVPTVGSISDPSGYKSISGTSMASPFVAGLAGLLLSKNPGLTNREVIQGIKQGVDVYNLDLANSSEYIGVGRVNVNKTLSATTFSAASAAITSPSDDFMAGSVQINGTASAPYRLLYGTGTYPRIWTDIASGPARSGQLGTLDAAVISTPFEDGTIKLVVEDQKGKVEAVVRGTLGKHFLPGWPQPYSTRGEAVWNSPNLVDIDKDGLDEILITGHDSSGKATVNVFKADGSQAAGWPQSVAGTCTAINFGPATGDVDGDGNLEVVAAVFSTPSLNLWDRWGNLRWSKVLEPGNPTLNATLADLNGDGKDEIIAQAYNSKIYALDGLGNILWSYDPGEYDSWYNEKTVAVADLDGDGKKEIIKNVIKNVRYNPPVEPYRTLAGTLLVLNSDGTVRWKYDWPQPSDNAAQTKYYQFHPTGSPLVADINNDGSPEILVKTRAWRATDSGTTEQNARFYAFDSNGAVLPGWPVTTYGMPSYGEMAVGDLKLDGRRVLVSGTTEKVLAIKDDGTLLFPPVSVYYHGNITIGDVTGDGKPDIFTFDGNNKFQVIQTNGAASVLSVLGRSSSPNVHNSPILTDLNKSGSEKLVFLDTGDRSVLWAWDLQIPHVPEAEQWSLFGFDSRHSGLLGSPSLSPVTIAASALPNALTGVPYSFSLTAAGGKAPYAWSITRGSLLSGLSLSGSTGLLSGTPADSGAATFTVRTVDAQGATAVRALALTSAAALPAAKVTGSGTRYFSLLQDAYNNCGEGETIQLQGVSFAESPRFDRDVTVVLSGGYDGSFSTSSGVSRIDGCMSVRFGKVKLNRVVLR